MSADYINCKFANFLSFLQSVVDRLPDKTRAQAQLDRLARTTSLERAALSAHCATYRSGLEPLMNSMFATLEMSQDQFTPSDLEKFMRYIQLFGDLHYDNVCGM